jgi:hypothetical protein
MKKIFCILIYFCFTIHSYSQVVSDQLTRLYNVPIVSDLSFIGNPQAGQLVFVVSENNGSDCVILGNQALNDNKGSFNIANGLRTISGTESTSNDCNANVAIGTLALCHSWYSRTV